MAKASISQTVKKAQNNIVTKCFINLDQLKYTKSEHFWKTLRIFGLSKKKTKTCLYIINSKQNIPDITSEFVHQFNILLNTSDRNLLPKDDLSTTEAQGDNTDAISSQADVLQAALKIGKSIDKFFVKNRTFSLCSERHTDFFMHIMRSGNVPELSSLIILLVKSYKKSLSDSNNYRGISLIPTTITKIMEAIIILKIPELKNSTNLQFGFTENSSTIHAEYIISETIKHYTKNGSPLFICSLDAEKAFESCNWPSLFS